MRLKQLSLIPQSKYLQNFKSGFGGKLLNGRRKVARPISTKAPMHLVIKSKHLIFKKYFKRHRLLLISEANRCHVKLYDFQLNGNHVHIVARFLAETLTFALFA